MANYKKGNGKNEESKTRSSWRRSYGTMIVLAFGAALVGVMTVQKLRERRIHNLILKHKDQDFYSLHLLLLKERDYNQEVKRKNEEIKAKIYSLRTQNTELERRVSEMQSTIDSLKDELKTLEVSLEEKQNDTKMLRAQLDDQIGKKERENKSSQIVELIEILKHKEAEITGLKQRREAMEMVSLVNSDDSSGSSPSVNARSARNDGSEDGEESEKTVENAKEENVEDREISDVGQRSKNEDDTSSTKEEHEERANGHQEKNDNGWVSLSTNTRLENNARSEIPLMNRESKDNNAPGLGQEVSLKEMSKDYDDEDETDKYEFLI